MVTLLTRSLWRKLRGMSAFTTEIARISKTKTKRITVGKKSVRNLFYRRRRQRSSSATSKTDVSLGLKEEINLLAAKVPPRCPPCCLHRSAQRACTFNISAERNLWLQSALRSFAIVCDYMETALFCDRLRSAICDPRSFAIVCDRLRSYGNQP